VTSGEHAGFAARIDAVLAEQERSLGALRQDSAVRAERGTATAAAATARFAKLAERVRQGARDRALPSPRDALAFDDPIAELEALIEPPPPDPAEPDDAEVDEILDTLLPLRPPADDAQESW
jgi:hypothetical protein